MFSLSSTPRIAAGRLTIATTDEESIDLTSLGRFAIRRAGHVEPDNQGFWTANLSPLDGPILGAFSTRSKAHDAEQAGIKTH